MNGKGLMTRFRTLGRGAQVLIVCVVLIVATTICCAIGNLLPEAPASDVAPAEEEPAAPEPTDAPEPTEAPEPTPTVPPPTDTSTPTKFPTATPTAAPTEPPTATPSPEAPTAAPTAASTEPPAPVGAILHIVAVDKRAEHVDIQNQGDQPQDLAGWVLVSEKGDQACALGGVIGPGETLRIWALAEDAGEGVYNCGKGGPIWNNSENDPAVLYDPAGQEVSRY